MNIKINKEQHEWLLGVLDYQKFLFGSRLLGVHKEDSDFDYLLLSDDNLYLFFDTPARYLPNIHTFQYTEGKHAQFLWYTRSQFWKNFFSGDGSILTDIVIFTEGQPFGDPLHLCYTYKVIKGLLGVTKRDLKKHKDWEKRNSYARKSLYMAECLINKTLPDIKEVQRLVLNEDPSYSNLEKMENTLRGKLNELLVKDEIKFYPEFREYYEIMQLMADSNNTKEFRYG